MFGFEGRGYLRPGYAADVCVFDPTTVAPGPQRRLRDLPADGERLTYERPTGVRHVMVNGTLIRSDDRQLALEQLPGTRPALV
jgi:N-acyl-D-aspartate/D-glutamate deacylase